MKKLYDTLLNQLGDGLVVDVRIGAFWTAVVVHVDGAPRCGLAATFRAEDHIHGSGPDVRNAGNLTGGGARELAELVHAERIMERSLGLAALNALLPRLEDQWTDGNAEEILAQRGAENRVAVVGHFPFVDRLRERVGTLWVLEMNPQEGDLPAEAAPDIIPQADLVAITGTTLLNDTFDGLMALCHPDSQVMVLGPSTPLSPILFDYGVDMISGAAVGTRQEDIDAVLASVSQGGGFRQVRKPGVRLVTMMRG
jgi:uncharacterized protein (DUF4213/DUF364 family)